MYVCMYVCMYKCTSLKRMQALKGECKRITQFVPGSSACIGILASLLLQDLLLLASSLVFGCTGVSTTLCLLTLIKSASIFIDYIWYT